MASSGVPYHWLLISMQEKKKLAVVSLGSCAFASLVYMLCRRLCLAVVYDTRVRLYQVIAHFAALETSASGRHCSLPQKGGVCPFGRFACAILDIVITLLAYFASIGVGHVFTSKRGGLPFRAFRLYPSMDSMQAFGRRLFSCHICSMIS